MSAEAAVQKQPLQMFAVKNDAATVGVIRIYSTIWGDSWWFRDCERNIRDLASQCSELEIRIHTYGGDVFNAIGIHNVIKSLGIPVTAYIDGVCASAGTIIACAADKVYMYTLGFYMIHLPTISMEGLEVKKAESLIAMVKEFTALAVQMYVKKTGLTEKEIQDMMDAETWLSSANALQKKFIDGIEEASPMQADPTALTTAMNSENKFSIFNCYKPKMADNTQNNMNGGGANQHTPPQVTPTVVPIVDNAAATATANFFNMQAAETRELIMKNAPHVEKLVMLIEKYGAGEVAVISNEITKVQLENVAHKQTIENRDREIAALKQSIRIATVTNAQKEGKITAQEAELFMAATYTDEQVNGIISMRKPQRKLSDAIDAGANMSHYGKTYLELSETNPTYLDNLRKNNPSEYQRLYDEELLRQSKK